MERVTPTPPTQLRIGHLNYTVTIDRTALDRETAEQGIPRRAGASHSATQLIELTDDMAPDYAAETLLHEILHQCLRVTAVDPDNDAKAGLDNVEERAVSAIAGPLLSALRDNPELITYLLGDDD